MELYCNVCKTYVRTHIEEAGQIGTADTIPVYVCDECDGTICDVGEIYDE